MRRVFSGVLGLALGVQLWGADFHDFDSYQGVYTQEEVREKIKSYLEKDPKVRDFYRLTEEALYIGNFAEGEQDYKLALAATAQQKSAPASKHETLQGVKIAIDPGHFGGRFARLEQRFVAIPAYEGGNEEAVSFDEGTLTYLTAVELKALLQAEGAEVMITRSGINQGAIGQDFFEWLKGQPQLWESKETLPQLFRNHYNRQDLHARAAKINAFKPDLTIILHYNAHLREGEKARKINLTSSDFNLLFVPGAFSAKELKSAEERYEFLRLIVTEDMVESVKLSQEIAAQLTDKLHVPLISESEEDASYIENASMKQAPGVYARNLALTRLVHSPLCYGETLIQNSVEEFQKLGAKEVEIDGVLTSSRVKEVAAAYFAGIKAYYAPKSD